MNDSVFSFVVFFVCFLLSVVLTCRGKCTAENRGDLPDHQFR